MVNLVVSVFEAEVGMGARGREREKGEKEEGGDIREKEGVRGGR